MMHSNSWYRSMRPLGLIITPILAIGGLIVGIVGSCNNMHYLWIPGGMMLFFGIMGFIAYLKD